MAFAAARTMLTTGFGVLTSHRALRAFPRRSAVTGAVVMGAPMLLVGTDIVGTASATPLLLAGAAYLLTMIVTTFGNAALIAQTDIVLRGGYPTAAEGRRAARARWAAVLLWALAAATVLPVLRLVEHDFRDMRAMRGRTRTAWADVANLTLPKIVLEHRNPIDALRDSRATLERGWGPGVASSARLGVVGYVLVLVGLLVSVSVGAALGAQAQAGIGLPYGAAVGGWFGLSVFTTALIFVSAATAVYQVALYRYTVDGRTPPAFAADLTRAFQP
ncbi:DUF6159 family protein [Nocardia sp. NPDC050713]|uniref:DUF6159 family protein n=1 Tax=Nocardia sp. NPDC050713 TaxID=3154511 RepID=UPI0033E23B9C